MITFCFALLLPWTAAATTNKDHSFGPIQQQGHVDTNTLPLPMAAITACRSLCSIVSSLCLAGQRTSNFHCWSRYPLLWGLRFIALALLTRSSLLGSTFPFLRIKTISDPAQSGHPDPVSTKSKSEDNDWNFWCKVLIPNSTLRTKGLIVPEIILISGANEQSDETPGSPSSS